jgi:hypothetical protein
MGFRSETNLFSFMCYCGCIAFGVDVDPDRKPVEIKKMVKEAKSIVPE